MSGVVDPVTFEVIRHKLMSITEEQRIAFQSISGSPVVTEASDYYTGLFLADGTIATMGYKVATQGGPMTLAIKMLMELFPAGELRPGDVFLANDPYHGYSCHPPDWGFFRPIFYQGKPVFWTLARAHVEDTGAAYPGAYFSDPYDVHSKAF